MFSLLFSLSGIPIHYKLQGFQTNCGREFCFYPLFMPNLIFTIDFCFQTLMNNKIILNVNIVIFCNAFESNISQLYPSKQLHFTFRSAYMINNLSTPITNDKSSFETLFHCSPNYLFYKVFSYLCYPYLRPYNKHKIN